MQTLKEQTRRQLLKTAREAFLERGFNGVSMREISKLSGISLSNIYNYFACKDELLSVVLRPLWETMSSMLERHNQDENLSLEILSSEEYVRKSTDEVLEIVTRFRKELKLMFIDTQDSRFQDYGARWVEKSTKVGLEYMDTMRKLYPGLHTQISPLFMRFSSAAWLNMIKEVVQHEELSHEEVERFILEYISFNVGGWKNLMRVESSGDKP